MDILDEVVTCGDYTSVSFMKEASGYTEPLGIADVSFGEASFNVQHFLGLLRNGKTCTLGFHE